MPRVRRALQVRKAFPALTATMEPMGFLGQQVLQARPGLLDRKANLGLRVNQSSDRRGHPEQMVKMAQMANPASRAAARY